MPIIIIIIIFFILVVRPPSNVFERSFVNCINLEYLIHLISYMGRLSPGGRRSPTSPNNITTGCPGLR